MPLATDTPQMHNSQTDHCDISPIKDKHNRQFRSLRISLTSACNFACQYCAPEKQRLQRSQDEMTSDMFCQAIDLLYATLRLEKMRITGGEPLLARSFTQVLAHLSTLDVETSLTTNAALLHHHTDALLASSVRRINISLDSLDAVRFRTLAKGGDLFRVLANIDWLLAHNFTLKINMVPMRGHNEADIVPLLAYCLERNIELRYIELMRMGHAHEQAYFTKHFISMSEILCSIKAYTDYEQLPRKAHSTAQRFQTKKGIFAFIPNESKPFCGDCDRLRLTSTGKLFGCISNQNNETMRDLLALPKKQAMLQLQQRLYNALHHKQATFHGQWTSMKLLGG